MEVMKDTRSSTMKGWKQNNVGKFRHLSQSHIKDEKHMNIEENKGTKECRA